jgi:cytochrome c oxidase subunit III
MSFLRHLTEKPWETTASEAQSLAPGGAASARGAPSTALNFFLAIASVLFLLLIMSYIGRMAVEDWRPAPQPRLLWQNTFLLVLASIAMEWARQAAIRDQIDAVKIGMIGGGMFTAGFVTGQVLAWRELAGMELFDATNPAIAFFYLITGLHAAHVLGGLVAWGWVLDRLWRGADTESLRRSVQLCTRYWHFLLVVWLVLFGLLFSGNNSLNFLLTICGIK